MLSRNHVLPAYAFPCVIWHGFLTITAWMIMALKRSLDASLREFSIHKMAMKGLLQIGTLLYIEI